MGVDTIKARGDLMEVVATSAAKSAEAVQSDQTARTAREWAQAAGAAAGAAASLEAVGSSEIEAALNALEQELVDAGLLQASLEEPEAFLKSALQAVIEWRRKASIGMAVEHGYVKLVDFLTRLERDFKAGGTETSTRLAARIRGGIDESADAITRAQRGEAPPVGEET